MTKHFLSSHTKLITDYYTSDFTTNMPTSHLKSSHEISCSQKHSVSWVILLKENIQQYLQYEHQCAADMMLFSHSIKQHRNQQLHCSTDTAGCSTECMILKNIKQLSKRKNSSWKS